MGLIAARGTQLVRREELSEVPVPLATRSYTPVPHRNLAELILNVGQKSFPDKELIDEQYCLSNKGQQMFAIATYGNGDETGMSIGYRNSYNKTLPVGIAMGASVMVCSNLCLKGEVHIFRRHTVNVWQDIRVFVSSVVEKAQGNYDEFKVEMDMLKGEYLADYEAYKMLGLLHGRDIISVTQLSIAMSEWKSPSHEEFVARNKWSFLNCVTEALKTAHPRLAMNQYIAAYNQIVQ